jgi:hypothetical protein
MITIFALILFGLVLLNFILLFTSVNKTTKKDTPAIEKAKRPVVTKSVSSRSVRTRLAPTGS